MSAAVALTPQEQRLCDANRQIGGLEMELKLTRGELAAAKAEVERLRALILGEVTHLENATIACADDLQALAGLVESSIARLADGRYGRGGR